MRPQHVLPVWVSIDLGVMEIKGYFTLPRSPEEESHHWMQFSVIHRAPLLEKSYPSAGDTVSVF